MFLENKPALENPQVVIEITSSELQKLCQRFYDRGVVDGKQTTEFPSFKRLVNSLFGNMN